MWKVPCRAHDYFHLCRCETPPPQHDAGSGNDQLLHSFSDFISVFEAHVQHHGRVHLPKPQRIAELLQELQTALVPPSPRPNVSPPPTYAEVVPSSYLHTSARRSSSSQVLHLRRENEQLRQVQRQCERLSAQLNESQVCVGGGGVGRGVCVWGSREGVCVWGSREGVCVWGSREGVCVWWSREGVCVWGSREGGMCVGE